MITTNKTLQKKFDKLNLLWNTSHLFDKALSELTPNELSKYELEHSTKERDITFYLWTYNVTYAYEAYWAMLLNMTDEELVQYALSKEDIPSNFQPDVKLKDIYPSYNTWDYH